LAVHRERAAFSDLDIAQVAGIERVSKPRRYEHTGRITDQHAEEPFMTAEPTMTPKQ